MEIKHINSKEAEIEEKEEGGLTLEIAREILGDTELNDEELSKIIQKVKIFCKVAYELYSTKQGNEKLGQAA